MPHSRQLAAIMFTDIVGYTALMQQDEKKALEVRNKHRRLFNSITEKHKGRILQYYGDGTLSVFKSAIEAVHCGIELQLGYQEEPTIPVRIGIHSGDIIFSDEEIIGDSVNVASRIESLALPGSVFISDKVYDEIKNQESIQTSSLNKFKLKNVERPLEVYVISNPGLIVPGPEEFEIKMNAEKASVTEKKQHFEPSFPKKGPLDTLLATKLYIPQPRSKIVQRPRLIERLNAGLRGKLTLISAQAGFGKTTLVSQWIAGRERPVAWLSLDESDNDPVRFLTYIVAAMQTIATNVGEGALGLLQSPQSPPTETILTALLNEVNIIENHFVMVLDDYHVINNKSVNDIVAFLVDHQPPQMHLIITSREDPDLPLARLRVRDQLTELRAADMRFTSSEAAGFLNQVMSLNLSEEVVETLEIKTEGWVAGLQLAALSMKGRKDIPGFIKAFAGHDRYIIDYLVEEVLQRQPEHIRSFLLQTSILDRLSASLCNAVTARNDGRKILAALERGNLFIISLDDERLWYRYHHLFADVLFTRLSDEQPELVPSLHQLASLWYEQNDLPPDAIRHTLSAGDFDRAAGLIEKEWPAMDRSYQVATWRNWAESLPSELFRNRPVLNTAYVWALMNTGDLEAAEARLRDIEKMLNNPEISEDPSGTSSAEMIVIDKDQFRSLPGSIATAYAYIAQTRGDLPGTVKNAHRALELFPEDDFMRRGTPTILLGLAYWTSGDLKEAYRSITDAMESFRMAGDMLFSISGTFLLADIRITQGRLNEAAGIYERSLNQAKEQGESIIRGTIDLHFGMSHLLCEQGYLEDAEKHMQKGEELLEQTGFWKYRLRLTQARIKESRGDLSGALDLLNQAERLYFRIPLPNLRPLPALKTRLWIKQGRLHEALDWVKERNLTVDDELNFLHEFEHITLVRVLIARYRIDPNEKIINQAIELLVRLLKAAEEGGRMGSMIELLVLQAMAHEAHGNISMALKPLKHALALAEPEGYISIFIEEGTPMRLLLSKVYANGILPDYTGELLARMNDAERMDKK